MGAAKTSAFFVAASPYFLYYLNGALLLNVIYPLPSRAILGELTK